MTSNPSENPLERHLTRNLINPENRFKLYGPITDEEFETSLEELGAYLLHQTQWTINEKNRKTLATLPVAGDTALVCRAQGCPYHDVCPIMKNLSEDAKEALVGTSCRAERAYGVTLFSDLAKDLDIQPDQTVDLLDAANIVRLMIYRRRLDWSMNIDGVRIDGVVAVNPISGEPFLEAKGHPLLKEIERLDKMIAQAKKNLVASRKDRIQIATQLGKGQTFLKSMFAKANDTYIDVNSNEGVLPPPEKEE